MNKGDIIATFENSQNIDVAVPYSWAKEVREYGIDPNDYAWDYRENNSLGKPVSLVKQLNEIYLEKLNSRKKIKPNI
jgi:hypothetical protein